MISRIGTDHDAYGIRLAWPTRQQNCKQLLVRQHDRPPIVLARFERQRLHYATSILATWIPHQFRVLRAVDPLQRIPLAVYDYSDSESS